MLCYLSQLWFTNPPCLREITRAMVLKKPLIALLESDTSVQHGGYHEAKCREILMSDEYADNLKTVMGPQVEKWAVAWDMPELQLPTCREIVEALFEKQPPIVWYRLADFQDVSMRLIAERLLQLPAAPVATESPYQQLTYMKGEIVQQVKGQLELPAVRADCRFHLYISPNSPGDGARGVARALQALLPSLTWTSDPLQLATCEHMIVLLTSKTWTRGEASDKFAAEVGEAMRKGVHRWLFHEVVGARCGDNEARHATSFENIIGATPKHIRGAQLYNEIAMNLGGGEWREAGLAKAARQLCKGSGTREQWTAAVREEDDLWSSAQGDGHARAGVGARPPDDEEQSGLLHRLISFGGKARAPPKELLPRGGLISTDDDQGGVALGSRVGERRDAAAASKARSRAREGVGRLSVTAERV